MSMVQIRNVPDDVHRKLKARAAAAGMSLSEYALAELRRAAEKPTRQEMLDRIAGRGLRNPLEPSSPDVVRELRHGR